MNRRQRATREPTGIELGAFADLYVLLWKRGDQEALDRIHQVAKESPRLQACIEEVRDAIEGPGQMIGVVEGQPIVVQPPEFDGTY